MISCLRIEVHRSAYLPCISYGLHIKIGEMLRHKRMHARPLGWTIIRISNERLQHRLQCCIGAVLNGHLRHLLHLVNLVSTAPNPSFPVTFLNLSGVSSRAKGVLKFAPKSSMYPTDSYCDFDGVRLRGPKKYFNPQLWTPSRESTR